MQVLDEPTQERGRDESRQTIRMGLHCDARVVCARANGTVVVASNIEKEEASERLAARLGGRRDRWQSSTRGRRRAWRRRRDSARRRDLEALAVRLDRSDEVGLECDRADRAVAEVERLELAERRLARRVRAELRELLRGRLEWRLEASVGRALLHVRVREERRELDDLARGGVDDSERGGGREHEERLHLDGVSGKGWMWR